MHYGFLYLLHVLVCCNNGMTLIITPFGQLVQELEYYYDI